MPIGGTIAAVSTAPGRSTSALIRISGPDTRAAAASCLGIADFVRSVRRVSLGLPGAFDARVRPLPIVAMLMPGPASFTGEDTLELLIPGGPALIGRVMDVLLACPGVRHAEPGEFSARAYLNARLSIEQAEGIAQRIAADTTDQLRDADALMDGSYARRLTEHTETLADCLALVEAGVDFSDQEDVIPIAPADLRARLAGVENDLAGLVAGVRTRQADRDQPEAVLVGVPNAGKSTLFNALLGRHRAMVSPRAGTTRDALAERLELGDVAPGAGGVTLVDLAGIDGVGVDRLDQAAQKLARERLARADLLIWCDPTGAFEARAITPGDGVPVVRVRTKADLLIEPMAERDLETGAGDAGPGVIALCALDGSNLQTLRRAIADACGKAGAGGASALPRHRHAIAATLAHLRAALALVDPARRTLDEPELIAGSLRSGIDALGELTGPIGTEDLLGRVFSSFCVGK